MAAINRRELEVWLADSKEVINESLVALGATSLVAAEVTVQAAPEPSLGAIERLSRYVFPPALPHAS